MRSLLLSKGEDWTLTHAQWQERKPYWSGLGAFAIAFESDVEQTTTCESVAGYDVVIANLDRDCIDKLLHLQQTRGNCKWVSLIERCATDYLVSDEKIKRLLDASDLVNVINSRSLDFFRALTSARCEYIGIPYPGHQIREQYFVPIEKREKRIMLPPYIDPPFIPHNPSYLAAKGFGEMYAMQRSEFNYGDEHYHALPPAHPIPYLMFEAASYVFVNLDHRYTWGRTVLDCAALGIPCITTYSTGHELFPDFELRDEFKVGGARYLIDLLLRNPNVYRESVERIDMSYFDQFTHEAVKQKILEAL